MDGQHFERILTTTEQRKLETSSHIPTTRSKTNSKSKIHTESTTDEYPEYQKPMITRVMQHFDGLDEIPNIHTTWDWKVENLQKDEQEARRYLQTIANRYPEILENFIELIIRMEEVTYNIGNDVFFIATDTVNDIMTQVRQLIGTIHEGKIVLHQERIEMGLLRGMNMFLPPGHVITEHGHHQTQDQNKGYAQQKTRQNTPRRR
jgi:hypothetical protein